MDKGFIKVYFSHAFGGKQENFVHILTHKGLKIAFRDMEELEKYVYENKLNKVYVMSVQYYKDKQEKGEKE